jgi:hypothetical protein
LISFQMMRVISSPSISTTGFFTLIFAILGSHLLRAGIVAVYSIDFRDVKGGADRPALHVDPGQSRPHLFTKLSLRPVALYLPANWKSVVTALD